MGPAAERSCSMNVNNRPLRPMTVVRPVTATNAAPAPVAPKLPIKATGPVKTGGLIAGTAIGAAVASVPFAIAWAAYAFFNVPGAGLVVLSGAAAALVGGAIGAGVGGGGGALIEWAFKGRKADAP